MSAAPAASKRPFAISRASAALRVIVVATLLATPGAGGAQTPGGPAQAVPKGAGEAATRIFDVKLTNGKWISASDTLRVKRGESVELRWSSDMPMNLHLHGYDLAISLQAGVPAVTFFMASLPGRFPVSNHAAGMGRERAVLYLEVLP